MEYDFLTSKVLLAGIRQRKLLSCSHLLTCRKNEGWLRARKWSWELWRLIPRPWDLIKEFWNCCGSATPLCRPFPPFFEQECLYQLPDTCDTIVFWMCGEQITCLFSFVDLHIERNCIQEALFKIHSGGDSSIPRLDLDDEILNLELLLWSTWGALGEVSVFCLWAQCE